MQKAYNFIFPNAQSFAKEAVKTLGVAEHVAGFWPHEIHVKTKLYTFVFNYPNFVKFVPQQHIVTVTFIDHFL